MRYKDTPGDDNLVGTSADDVFKVRLGGSDTVNGAGGLDRLIVNYGGTTFGTTVTSFMTVSADGALSGTLSAGGFGMLYRNIEQVAFTAGNGNDTLVVSVSGATSPNAMTADGRAGMDVLDIFCYGSASHVIEVSSNGALTADFGTFSGFEQIKVNFGAGRDSAVGGKEADFFYGGDGDDQLSGGGGDDLLWGGHGHDTLAGGEGADTFYMKTVHDSRVKNPDVILDFNHAEGDVIDLRQVDADRAVPHNQTFVFIGQAAFTGAGGTNGEVRQEINGDGTVTLQGDVNHDGIADFAILVHSAMPLVAADFLL